jgi:hypothetical protein
MLVDELVFFFDWRLSSAPKECAAALEVSFSRRKFAFSRLYRLNFASSAVVASGLRPVSFSWRTHRRTVSGFGYQALRISAGCDGGE